MRWRTFLGVTTVQPNGRISEPGSISRRVIRAAALREDSVTTLVLEQEPAAAQVQVSSDRLVVTLVDGRVLSVPLNWYPRLLHASEAERQNVVVLGAGYALEWPDLDEHIGVEGLLAGRRSGESAASLERWQAARGRAKSEPK